MWMRFSALLTTLALLVSIASAETPAATPEQRRLAKESFRRGNQHYNLGEYKEACAAFKTAYRYVENPLLLFNLGQCERMLDNKAAAAIHYKAYLRTNANASNAAQVQGSITKLELDVAAEKAAAEKTAAEERRKQDEARAAEAATRRDAPLWVAAPSKSRPLHKRWWLWTAVGGGVVAVALGIGLGVGLTRATGPSAMTTAGTFSPFQ